MLVWSNQLVLWNRDNFFYTIQCCWDIWAEVQSRNTSHTDDKTFCKVFYNDMFNGVSGTGISPAYGIRTTRTMTSSISERCFPLIIPSATTQESSDSMEASIAIVNASEADCPMISKFTFGRWKAGSELLIVYKSPMVFAFHGRNFTITIPAITAIRDPGIFLKM